MSISFLIFVAIWVLLAGWVTHALMRNDQFKPLIKCGYLILAWGFPILGALLVMIGIKFDPREGMKDPNPEAVNLAVASGHDSDMADQHSPSHDLRSAD